MDTEFNPDRAPEKLNHLNYSVRRILEQTGIDIPSHEMVDLLVELLLSERQAVRQTLAVGIDFWLDRQNATDKIRDGVTLLATRLIDTEDGIAIDQQDLDDGEAEEVLGVTE